MTDDEKETYYKIVKEDAIRFEREMSEFNEMGYYTNSEGIKSNLTVAARKWCED